MTEDKCHSMKILEHDSITTYMGKMYTSYLDNTHVYNIGCVNRIFLTKA